MRKLFKKFLIYLLAIGMLMPTWLVTGMMSAQHVKAADITTIISEGFLSVTSLVVAPTDWTFSGIVNTYTTDPNSGQAIPSLKFETDGSAVETPSFSGATNLSYWVKGFSVDADSSLIISGYATDWQTLSTLKPIPTTGKTEQVSLTSDITKIRFSYIKSEGNVALDDVLITGEVNLTILNNTIATAQALVNEDLLASTTPGDHVVGAREILIAAITAANTVIVSSPAQSVVDAAVTTLNSAISAYDAAVVPLSNITALETAIAAAQAKHDASVGGIEPNNYAVRSKAVFLAAIDTARTITANSSQSVVNDAVTALAAADAAFEAGRVLSPDTNIVSEVYAIGDSTITNVPFGTSKADFLAALSNEASQTWDDADIDDPVVTDNTLIVTAEDETTTATYTVTVLSLEDTATNAVVKAEATPTQANVDSAQALISELLAGELRTELEARLDVVKEIVAANVLEAGLVSSLIDKLPALADLTLANTTVGEARIAYNALTPEGKALVLNYSTLTGAEAQLAALQTATNAVSALETASALDLTIEANLVDAENALTEANAALQSVANGAEKTSLSARVVAPAETIGIAREAFDVNSVLTQIAALPVKGTTILLTDAPKVAAARTAYDALSEAGKALILNYQILVDAEAAIDAMTTGTDSFSAYLIGTVSKAAPLVFDNMTIGTNSETPQNIEIKRYLGVPTANALSFGAGNFYYEIVTTSGEIFPLTLTLDYSDDKNNANYLDETKFNSLYYYSSGEWKDYRNDSPNPGIIDIGKANNKITATIYHLTPIAIGYDLTAPAVPNITKTTVSGTLITVEWDKVADAEGYYVYLSSEANGAVTLNNYIARSEKLTGNTYSFRVGNYGKYYVAVAAVDAKGNASVIPNSMSQTLVNVAAPATSTSASGTSKISVGPERARAQAGNITEEQKIETSPTETPPATDDSNGQIKGDESSDEDGDNKVNWTPWIVLFVLILLAGAATGGYFYWFNGEDEVEATVREPKKEEKNTENSQNNNKNQNNQKKQKRW